MSNINPSENCPLCNNEAVLFYEDQFFRCPSCRGIFRGENFLPSAKAEKERYDLHENNVEDSGYLEFIAPITSYLKENAPKNATLLDFGSGPSSGVSSELKKEGFIITEYDPFYRNDKSLLKNKYDYIIACEVIEHFHFPDREFFQLRTMLKSNGKLIAMTHLYSDDIDFSTWYYKNDPTHTFFYTKETIERITEQYGFDSFIINGRLIIWES